MERASLKANSMTDRKPKNIFVKGPIAPAFIAESIEKHNKQKQIGAHSIFLGQGRADSMGQGQVQAIEYSCYEDMALEKMHEIRESIFSKYELTCMHVYHSLGRVEAGEISLFVFTSSAHRKNAIRACEELVETIKAELPVWGKELMDDQTSQWKENK